MRSDAPFMPFDARIADVLGLLDVIINEFGGSGDLYKIAKEMDYDLEDLIPALDAAKYLGFIIVINGDVKVTELGKKFLNSKVSERKKILRQVLTKLEPFKTAYKLGLEKYFTIDELVGKLDELGYFQVREPKAKEALIMLISEWGVFSGLFKRINDKYYTSRTI